MYGRIVGRNRHKNTEDLSQEIDSDGSHGRNLMLESQQDFEALGGKRNQNQGEPGSHTSHRELLAHERAQSDSGTPRQGRRSTIFSTIIQQFQTLQDKGNVIQRFPIIPGIFQKKKRSLREKQKFFQLEEERSRPLDEETNGLSPSYAHKQK
ncbi:hypothetical protein O181_044597 [Austropuccinia psidii MF-1]|uniref:Uncharacterized protein n=1 Tax=Austropuccinia psidii MF-1 TaxID=1389203 RepID=A0A9Q3HHX5_9BASI|nr:hypothetical protein [Austropuccinia psidii MF-1]